MINLPINYAMCFTKHALQRLEERYPNLTSEDLLCDEITQVDAKTYNYYLENCHERSKVLMKGGARVLVKFSTLGIIAPVDCSSMKVLTVLPTANKNLEPKINTEEQITKALRDKAKKAEKLPQEYRNVQGVRLELHRIYLYFSSIKKDKAPQLERLKLHALKVENENKAMRDFVKNNFGLGALNELYEVIDKSRKDFDLNHKMEDKNDYS